MDDGLVPIARSARLKPVDYRDDKGQSRKKKVSSGDNDDTNDKNVASDGKHEAAKKVKTTVSGKKTVSLKVSSKPKPPVPTAAGPDSNHSDDSDDDDDEIESLDENEDLQEMLKLFKERGKTINRKRKFGGRGIPVEEITQAKQTALQELARFKRPLEPFVTPQVLELLDKAAASRPPPTVKKASSKSSLIDADDEPDATIASPKALAPTCKLKPYQMEGLTWLVSQYNKCINSILADEMGLGKTLQSIALIAHLVYDKKLPGQHLIVVPLSVIFNWISEFKKFCPMLKVRRIHSNDPGEQQRLLNLMRDETQTQVAVTTYDALKSSMRSAFKEINWRTVILDEGHRIKNEESDTSQTCGALRARFKLILTGTPVQNDLHEAWVMLQFLAPQVFTSSSAFDKAFLLETKSSSSSSARSRTQIDRKRLMEAHYLMRLFVLRRLKSEVEKKLPPKLETKINCPMTALQLACVRKLLLNEQSLLLRSADGTGSSDGLKNLKSLVSQLRKAANHPFLFEGVESVAVDGRATEEIVTASGKMMVLDKLLRRLRQRGHRVVLFSQFTRTLDIICDYLDLRAHPFVRLDGTTNRVLREVNVNRFNEKKSKIFIFCLSTRAGGEGINLVSADTVILFDSDWNPQVDVQAMARVHRIGQTKPVHIYRLVTAGSIEERIVQRAQKKLFLDGMVNRGSTAQGKKFDELQQKKQKIMEAKKEKQMAKRAALLFESPTNSDFNEAEQSSSKQKQSIEKSSDLLEEKVDERDNDVVADDEDVQEDEGLAVEEVPSIVEKAPDEEEQETGTDFLSMLRFGWNSVFSARAGTDGLGENELTDEDIDLIIDRTRGLDPTDVVSSATGNQDPSAKEAAVKLNEKYAKLMERQEQALSSFDENEAFIAVSGDHLQKFGSNLKNMSFKEIAVNVNRDISSDNIVEGKRQSMKRTKKVHVAGHGEIEVLNANDYDMDEGEPSVLKREMSSGLRKQSNSSAFVFVPQSRRQIAGRDYDSFEHCQICWDGGDIILCDVCPNSFHLVCLGLKEHPTDKIWYCPHHSCILCKRKSTQCALLFRCEMCSEAYCEDCLPADAKVLGPSQRYETARYRLTSSTCYINCSPTCIANAKKEYNLPDEDDDNDEDDEVVEEDGPDDTPPEDPQLKSASDNNVLASVSDPIKSKLNSAAADVKASKPDNSASASNTAAATAAARVLTKEALAACTLPDVLTRLCVHPRFRFKNVKEIPLFETRLDYAPAQIKGLLLEIMHLFPRENSAALQSVDDALERIYTFEGMPVEPEVFKMPVYAFNASTVPPLPPPAPKLPIVTNESTPSIGGSGGETTSNNSNNNNNNNNNSSNNNNNSNSNNNSNVNTNTVVVAPAPPQSATTGPSAITSSNGDMLFPTSYAPSTLNLSAPLPTMNNTDPLRRISASSQSTFQPPPPKSYADLEQKYIDSAFAKFIKIVGILTQAKKLDLNLLAHLLGVGLVYSPLPPPKDENKKKYYISEPRFRLFTAEGSTSASSLKSNVMLELLAAFFVNPTPLNLLWHQKELDSDSSVTLIVCRHLEALVQPLKINYCGEFMTATSAKSTKPHDSITHGESVTVKGVPKGKKFTAEELREVLAPSLRMYNLLKNEFHVHRDSLRRLHPRTAINTCLAYFAPIVNAPPPVPQYKPVVPAPVSSAPTPLFPPTLEPKLSNSSHASVVNTTNPTDDWLFEGAISVSTENHHGDECIEIDMAEEDDDDGADEDEEDVIDNDDDDDYDGKDEDNEKGSRKRKAGKVDSLGEKNRKQNIKKGREQFLGIDAGRSSTLTSDSSSAVPWTSTYPNQQQKIVSEADVQAHLEPLKERYLSVKESVESITQKVESLKARQAELTAAERDQLIKLAREKESGSVILGCLSRKIEFLSNLDKASLERLSTHINPPFKSESQKPSTQLQQPQPTQHQQPQDQQQQQDRQHPQAKSTAPKQLPQVNHQKSYRTQIDELLKAEEDTLNKQYLRMQQIILKNMLSPGTTPTDDEALLLKYHDDAKHELGRQYIFLRKLEQRIKSAPLSICEEDEQFCQQMKEEMEKMRMTYMNFMKEKGREEVNIKNAELYQLYQKKREIMSSSPFFPIMAIQEVDNEIIASEKSLNQLQRALGNSMPDMEFAFFLKTSVNIPLHLKLVASMWMLKRQSRRLLEQLNKLIQLQIGANSSIKFNQLHAIANKIPTNPPSKLASHYTDPYQQRNTQSNKMYSSVAYSSSNYPTSSQAYAFGHGMMTPPLRLGSQYPSFWQAPNPLQSAAPYMMALPPQLPPPFMQPVASFSALESSAHAPRSEQMRRAYLQSQEQAISGSDEQSGWLQAPNAASSNKFYPASALNLVPDMSSLWSSPPLAHNTSFGSVGSSHLPEIPPASATASYWINQFPGGDDGLAMGNKVSNSDISDDSGKQAESIEVVDLVDSES